MNDSTYIQFLEEIVLALLKERKEHNPNEYDIRVEHSPIPFLTGCTVSVYNLTEMIEKKKRTRG